MTDGIIERERIVIADDHPVFREGVRLVLERVYPSAALLEATDWDEVLKIAREGTPPSTFMLDLLFPGMDVESSIGALRREFPRASIVIISMVNDRDIIDRAMREGADGFIGKDVPPAEVAAAIEEIRDGAFVVRTAATGGTAPRERGIPALTLRQRDVLRHMIAGKSNKEIARELGISPFTVRIHVSALLRLFGVSTRAAAAVKGAEAGI
ncbi:MAG: response regulator transcription factor [Proteobacteria bacterium]|nr:response regulator transcription factor [Pseudomonadota bacterium]